MSDSARCHVITGLEMFLSQVCKFSTKAAGGHCLPVCLNKTSAPSALQRGGVRAGAFPVVEGLRLALLASAGASRRSCVRAGEERYRVRTSPLPKVNVPIPLRTEGLQLHLSCG